VLTLVLALGKPEVRKRRPCTRAAGANEKFCGEP
jgi:hypothetical protein